MGADEVINSRTLTAESGLVGAIKVVTDGQGCDLAVETAGHQVTQVQAAEICYNGRQGGLCWHKPISPCTSNPRPLKP